MTSPSNKEQWSIIMQIDPMGKGRPRATKGGRIYTPGKTRLKEEEIRYWLIKENAPRFYGALKVAMGFGFERPKSVSQKKRPYHTVSPDLDNCVKLLSDAGNKILWDDDKQIVDLRAYKFYTASPYILLTVEEVSTEPETKEGVKIGND